MTTFNILRFIHLLFYFLVAVQLTYYVYLMGDALKLVNIASFLDERRIVHPMVLHKHKAVYYLTLFLSLLVIAISLRYDRFTSITYTIAFICLVTEVIIAVKGNGPLNELVQQFSSHESVHNWEEIRSEWIRLIKLRGYIILVGMTAIFAGLIFRINTK